MEFIEATLERLEREISELQEFRLCLTSVRAIRNTDNRIVAKKLELETFTQAALNELAMLEEMLVY